MDREIATRLRWVLMHRIRKGQFDLTSVHRKDDTPLSMWVAVH